MSKTLSWLLIAGSLLFSLAGATAPNIVVSIAPIHSLAASVLEGVSEPKLLFLPSITPHNFTMQPSHARAIAKADIVIWIGPRLETALIKPLKNLKPQQKLLQLIDDQKLTIYPKRTSADFVFATKNLEERMEHSDLDTHADEHEHEHEHGENTKYDPHLWLSIENAIAVTSLLAAKLTQLDPSNSYIYQRNKLAQVARLQQLQQDLQTKLAGLQTTRFVVFHDAYQYFERSFGLAASGVININPATPPSAARVGIIRNAITNQQVNCVFSEPQFHPKLVAALVKGTNTTTRELDPLGARLTPGASLYPILINNMADDFIACLAK